MHMHDAQIRTYLHMHAQTYAHMHMHMLMHTDMHTHTLMHTHMCTRTTHLHAHAYTYHVQAFPSPSIPSRPNFHFIVILPFTSPFALTPPHLHHTYISPNAGSVEVTEGAAAQAAKVLPNKSRRCSLPTLKGFGSLV